MATTPSVPVLSKQELEHFKRIILEKRRGVLEEMDHKKENGLNSTIVETNGGHPYGLHMMAELGTDMMEREKAFLFTSRESNLLYHLEQALERIEAGNYGLCVDEECGRDISAERLEEVPHVQRCIECETKKEVEKIKNNHRRWQNGGHVYAVDHR